MSVEQLEVGSVRDREMCGETPCPNTTQKTNLYRLPERLCVSNLCDLEKVLVVGDAQRLHAVDVAPLLEVTLEGTTTPVASGRVFVVCWVCCVGCVLCGIEWQPQTTEGRVR